MDYYNNENNEGHIFIKIINTGIDEDKPPIVIKKGDGIAQGLIIQYFTTKDDISTEIRNGGFGSTDQNGGK